MYRGLNADTDDELAMYLRQFLEGDEPYAGSGLFGTGHYTSNLRETQGPITGLPGARRTPFTSLISEASPTRGGITIKGSPISKKGGPSADRGASHTTLPVSTPAARRMEKSSQDRAYDERIWQTPSTGGTGAFRIKIGSVGVEKTEARKGMEGINSVLRRSSLSAQRHNDLVRDAKQPPSTAGSMPHPSSTRFGASSATKYAPTPNQRASFKVEHSLSTPEIMTPASARRGTGKENTENELSTNPCNCKKSKCLNELSRFRVKTSASRLMLIYKLPLNRQSLTN